MKQSSARAYHDPNKSKEKRYGYDKRGKNINTIIIDKQAGLIYEEKHWKPLSKLNPSHIDSLLAGKSPATIMQENHICDGVLHLSGNFVEKHKQEIIGTIQKYDRIARRADPLNSVQSIEQSGPVALTVYTAKNQLAVHIGKKIARSFKGGTLKIHWSKHDKPVELWWHKDLK